MNNIDSYTWSRIFSYFILFLGFISSIQAYSTREFNSRYNGIGIPALLLALLIIVYMGLMPIGWGTANDRSNYAYVFLNIQRNGLEAAYQNEKGFALINYIIGLFCNVTEYFIVVAAIYVSNYMAAIKRITGKFNYWLLLAVILSMGFTSYNTNTMRAGLAISFIVLGLSYYKNLCKMSCLLALSIFIHNSMIIPCGMILLSRF